MPCLLKVMTTHTHNVSKKTRAGLACHYRPSKKSRNNISRPTASDIFNVKKSFRKINGRESPRLPPCAMSSAVDFAGGVRTCLEVLNAGGREMNEFACGGGVVLFFHILNHYISCPQPKQSCETDIFEHGR